MSVAESYIYSSAEELSRESVLSVLSRDELREPPDPVFRARLVPLRSEPGRRGRCSRDGQRAEPNCQADGVESRLLLPLPPPPGVGTNDGLPPHACAETAAGRQKACEAGAGVAHAAAAPAIPAHSPLAPMATAATAFRCDPGGGNDEELAAKCCCCAADGPPLAIDDLGSLFSWLGPVPCGAPSPSFHSSLMSICSDEPHRSDPPP